MRRWHSGGMIPARLRERLSLVQVASCNATMAEISSIYVFHSDALVGRRQMCAKLLFIAMQVRER